MEEGLPRFSYMNMNVFVKSDDQSQTSLSFGMARKGGMKSNVFVKPTAQNHACMSFGMARKGGMKSNAFVKPYEQGKFVCSATVRKDRMKCSISFTQFEMQKVRNILHSQAFNASYLCFLKQNYGYSLLSFFTISSSLIISGCPFAEVALNSHFFPVSGSQGN